MSSSDDEKQFPISSSSSSSPDASVGGEFTPESVQAWINAKPSPEPVPADFAQTASDRFYVAKALKER